MKFEVAISVYNSPHLWEWQVTGLLANADHISRVIRVFDGEWPSDTLDLPLPFPELRLSQEPRDLCGISRTVNLGVRSAEEDAAVLHLDDDTLLYPGALETISKEMSPGRLVCPCVLRVDDRFGTHPRSDPNLDMQPRLPHDRIKGCFWTCFREDFLAMDGWNEKMIQYGYQDAEFAARWAAHFGEPAIWPILTELAAVIDPQPSAPKYKPESWYKAVNWRQLNEALLAQGRVLHLPVNSPPPSVGVRQR